MAASIARLPINSLRQQIITVNPVTPFDHKLKPTVKIHGPYSTRRRNVLVLASSNDSENNGGNGYNKNSQALELHRILDSNTPPYHVVSNDSSLLPSPLSSHQSSNLVSDGSHLRVAYQGVRGAYSESAAEKAYPNCEAVPCEQFDIAFEHVAFHKLKDTGAVASSSAAMIYGLNILAQDIQDDSENVTRFLMLAREPIIPGTDRLFKTSIVFSLEEGPGVLFKALAVFALQQINLTKIESRPLRKQPLRASDDNNHGFLKYFDYHFYMDFEASMADEKAQNALRHLNEFATFLRVLGSYPVDTTMI